MGLRGHVAASTCCVISGLFLCGLGGALAIAEPTADPETVATDGDGQGASGPQEPNQEPDPAEDPETKPSADNGGGNGHCGNDGGSGNTRGCGKDTETPDPTDTRISSPSATQTTSATPTSRTTTRTTETTSTSTSTSTSAPGLPPDGDGSPGGEVPDGRPAVVPEMRLPDHLPAEPVEPVGAAPGVGVAALPPAPVSVPVLVAPSAGTGAVAGAASAPLPEAPRVEPAEPPAARPQTPAGGLSNVSGPATAYRAGYTDYLRTAGVSQVIALAAPGLAGILVLTGAGGLVGYRQAKAGHAVRAGGVARFVN